MSAQRDIPIVNTRRHFVKEFSLPAATEARSVAVLLDNGCLYSLN